MTSKGTLGMTIIAMPRADRDELERDIENIIQDTLIPNYGDVQYYVSARTGEMLHYIELLIKNFDIDSDVASPGDKELIDFYEMISKIENRAQLLSVYGTIRGDSRLKVSINDRRATTVAVIGHDGEVRTASQWNASHLFDVLHDLHRDNQVA